MRTLGYGPPDAGATGLPFRPPGKGGACHVSLTRRLRERLCEQGAPGPRRGKPAQGLRSLSRATWTLRSLTGEGWDPHSSARDAGEGFPARPRPQAGESRSRPCCLHADSFVQSATCGFTTAEVRGPSCVRLVSTARPAAMPASTGASGQDCISRQACRWAPEVGGSGMPQGGGAGVAFSAAPTSRRG